MSNYQTDSVEGIVALIRKERHLPRLLTIDGWMGAGKSLLADALAHCLSVQALDLDCFLIPDQKAFVNAIRIDELRKALSDVPGSVIVSGVCVKHVLQLVGCTSDCTIYVKRMAIWGWADEDEIYGNLLEQTASEARSPVPPLHLEVRAYHQRYRPEESADLVFLRARQN